MSIHWSASAWMWPLLLVVAAGAVLWTVAVYRATRPASSPVVRRTLTVLRAAVFVLLVVAIAGPVLSRRALDREPAELLIVVDDSASMATADAAGGRTRWAQARRIAAVADSLLEGRGEGAVVRLLAGNGLEPLERVVPGSAPDAYGTDLNALVEQSLRQAAGRPVRALVVIGDGHETRRRPEVTLPGAVPQAAVVGVGDPEGPADRLLRDIRYPESVHQGDDVVVEVLVDQRPPGGPPQEVRLTLTGVQGILADTTLAGVTGAVPVVLTVPARQEGLLAAELSVSPLVNERFLANNSVSLAVNVTRDRSRVLLLLDRGGWDGRFLAQAAAEERGLALTVVYGGPGGMVRADSLTAWAAPVGADGWAAWDAVVLGGWQGQLRSLDWPGLAAAVRGGLGLVLVPGAAPDLPGMPGAVPLPLADVLPVVGDGARNWRQAVWPLAMTPGAVRHPLLAGVSVHGGDWPPVASLLQATPRAEATVLLDAGPRGAAGPGTPVLVAWSPGQGRVAWYGGRRLWELAFADMAAGARDDRAESGGGRRLLRNLLVWAATGDDDAGLVFTDRGLVHGEGEPVRISAQWRDMRGDPVLGRTVRAAVRRIDDAAATAGPVQTYATTTDGDGRWDITLPPQPPGRYAVSLEGSGEPPTLSRERTFVVAGRSVEDVQVRRDQRRIDLLGSSLGAVVLDGDGPDLAAQLDRFLRQTDWNAGRVERLERWEPAGGWPLLAVLALLLGAEWLLRRRAGLL